MNSFQPSGIHHLTLRVNRIKEADDFYQRVLGFELVRKMGQSMSVFRIGEQDTLVLVEAETSYDAESRDFRMDHFGFYLETPEQVDELAEKLQEEGIRPVSGPANRKHGRFFFITDPDGNMIEFFSEKEYATRSK
jgi:catechol 2,3-dioxygenase-like lactoylglutathione lyase family enzyme